MNEPAPMSADDVSKLRTLLGGPPMLCMDDLMHIVSECG
jgi:hypothetical protein